MLLLFYTARRGWFLLHFLLCCILAMIIVHLIGDSWFYDELLPDKNCPRNDHQLAHSYLPVQSLQSFNNGMVENWKVNNRYQLYLYWQLKNPQKVMQTFNDYDGLVIRHTSIIYTWANG